MFDIGFLEIMVILVIALLVIGPERMPEVARKLGQFAGKMRRFVNSMKEDSQVQDTLRELHDSVNFDDEKKQLDSLSTDLQKDLNGGMEDLDMDQFQRPFGGESSQSGSQFNRAPAQPNIPQPPKTPTEQPAQSSEEQSKDNDPAATSNASQTPENQPENTAKAEANDASTSQTKS